MTSRKIIGIVGTVVAIPLLLFACGILKVEVPVRGQVIDADTKKVVQGAAVRLDRSAHCPRGFHGSVTHKLATLETITDVDGRFSIGGRVTIPPCIYFPRWSVSLDIVAPGYFAESAYSTDLYITGERPVQSGTFELHRMRYLIELDEYGYVAKGRPVEDAESVWGKALSTAERLPFQRVDRPGVFVSQPGAVFDQIAVVKSAVFHRLLKWMVVTQDRNTGSVYGWTTKGTPVPVPGPPASGASMLGGRRSIGKGYPFFVHKDRIYFPEHRSVLPQSPWTQHWFPSASQFGGVRAADDFGYVVTVEADGEELAAYSLERWSEWVAPGRKRDGPRQILPGPRLKVSEVLPGGRPPIECITSMKGARDNVVFIAHAADERALFVLPFGKIGQNEWVAERVQLPRGTLSAEVTACAAGRDSGSLYVALRDRGIMKLQVTRFQGWKSTWKVRQTKTLLGPNGPLNFSSLAVGEIDRFWHMLYAVAGDDKIYRFDADLRPDQRIEFDLGSLPPDHPTR